MMVPVNEIFSPQFLIQIFIYTLIVGIAWGSMTSKLRTVTSRGDQMEKDVQANNAHRVSKDIHMPLEKQLEVFVSKDLYEQSQADLRKNLQALTNSVNDLQKDVKELLKRGSGS